MNGLHNIQSNPVTLDLCPGEERAQFCIQMCLGPIPLQHPYLQQEEKIDKDNESNGKMLSSADDENYLLSQYSMRHMASSFCPNMQNRKENMGGQCLH